MSFLNAGVLISKNLIYPKHNLNKVVSESCKILQIRCYAARKGTREKRRKAKVKVEVEKVGFIPHNQRNRELLALNREQRKFDDSWKKDPIDNVYVAKYFKWVVYPFAEAVQCHRETHHPEMYNKPEANLYTTIELNMEGEKKTRFVDNFTRIVGIPHKFDHSEIRTVIAFAKDPESQQQASVAGAQLSGGIDLIKQIQNGEVSLQNFQHIIAHPDILPELVSLRGLMKKRFPNPKIGTLSPDLEEVVNRFLHGISYSAKKDEFEKDFGIIDVVIGTLNMDVKHLEENFAELVRDVCKMKPKRKGPFISRCLLWSRPSPEKLKVDHSVYLDSEGSKDDVAEQQQEEEEEIEEKVTL